MAISKSVLHIFYNSYSEDRPSFLVSILYFLSSSMSKSIAGHSEISWITANQLRYSKFCVKTQPQSEKSYQFCWKCINFVHQKLMKKAVLLFLTTPNGFFFSFYLGWGSKIACKINALFTDQVRACLWKKYYNNYRKKSGVQIHLVNGILWLKH